jgi:hypothetical protein
MQKPKTKNFCDLGKSEIKIRAIIKNENKTKGEISKNEAIKIPPMKEKQK